MKKLELQNFGVLEMDAKEMIETDGGLFGLANLTIGKKILDGIKEGVGFVGGAVSDVLHGVVDGFKDGAK